METQFQERSAEGFPSGLRIIREGLGLTRYVLPKRTLGAARKIGWGPFGLGLFITLFMIAWMRGAMAGSLSGDGLGRWLGIAFGLMGLPGLAVGLGLMVLGIAILANSMSSEIVVGEGMIRAVERIGPIPLRRSRRVGQLTRLVVGKGAMTVTDRNRRTTTTLAGDWTTLHAEVSTGKPFLLLIGYPYEVVRPLADTLAAGLSLGLHTAENGTTAAMEVIEPEAEAPAADIEIPKPPGTDILLLMQPHGLAISVPPRGLRKGSAGLFFFSLMWNGFMTVMTVATIRSHPPVPIYLFMVSFWAIGLGLLAGAIHMGKRKILIAVVNDVLACRTISPFRTSERKVALTDITAIQVGPSGIEVNDRPIMEVQIIPGKGRKIGLLSNRTAEELDWVARVLRQHLRARGAYNAPIR